MSNVQYFDKVWHEGIIQKQRIMSLKHYSDFLTSNLSDRLFGVKQGHVYSDFKIVKPCSFIGKRKMTKTEDITTVLQETV